MIKKKKEEKTVEKKHVKAKAKPQIKPQVQVEASEAALKIKPKATKPRAPAKSKIVKPKAVKKPVAKKTQVVPAAVKEAMVELPVVAAQKSQEAAVITPQKTGGVIQEKPHVEAKAVPKKEEVPAVKKEVPQVKPAPVAELKVLELDLPITLKDLAIKLQEKSSNLIKILMGTGKMVGINQMLDEATVSLLCSKYGYKVKKALSEEETVLEEHEHLDASAQLKARPPIVTFMGHVDHGKTSLLDAIRKTKVADSEHGGITQHIGAYRVVLPGGEITFLDTPGHEAFTAMRSRGAHITDIVVLVVAADDGVMPQTQEAIDHARAADVPIIVAINKIDKPGANPDKVKKQLSELGLTPEDWGGKTITAPVSAKTGEGIDNLLEMIILDSQMLELKANPLRPAKGVIIEAKMNKGRGVQVTLLVQNGTLHLNDNVIVGQYYGKIRALFDDHGRAVTEAGPAVAVEVLGIAGLPEAGTPFFAVEEEKTAREIASSRQEKEKIAKIKEVKRISLEDLHAQIQEGVLKDLKIIIKADVQGSLEAIKQTLDKLNISEVNINIIHAAVGDINSSDAVLAVASNALIVGFNVQIDERAKETIDKEGIEVKSYNIIYELANEIKLAVEGMLEPKLKKVFLGRAEIRKVFKLSRSGIIAGCFVTKGKINRNSQAALLRNGEQVFEGKISSLKRFKDDVKDVAEGFECGIALGGFDDYKEGDIVEAFEIEKIARKL